MNQTDLKDILNGFSDVAFFLGNDRTILAANDPAERGFGKIPLGEDFVRVVRKPEVLRLIDQHLREGGKSEEVFTLEARLKGLYRATVSRVGSAGVIVSFADLSAVRAADQMRSDFIANVSHELRSPLTALTGFIETLQGPAKDDEAARVRFLGLMNREASRMDRLIGDLLSLSKVEVDARIQPRDRVDVVDLIRRTVATLSNRAEREKVSIQVKLPSHGLWAEGDEDQLTQVFLNLIENAVKYGAERGAITVEADRLPQTEGVQRQTLCVKVKDNGPGIARRHLPRLTERFYRVDEGRSRDKGGTGLGLAIVKHIVQRHRGRLLIDSIEGQGSVFTVMLMEADQKSPDQV